MGRQDIFPTQLYVRALWTTASSLTFAATSAVHAEAITAQAVSNNASNYLEEVVVTAQKRLERLQDVPLAVTAIGAEDIARRGGVNIVGISKLAPNTKIEQGLSNPMTLAPFIRGIGTQENGPESDLPIAVSVDGVYLGSVYGGYFNSFDIERVEILRGPQGTLQGRNAPGGAVNIITRRPGDTWTARGMAEYGRFSDTRINVGADGPLIDDKLGIKVAAFRHYAEGYQTGIQLDGTPTGKKYGGSDTWGMSTGVKITPSDNLNIWLAGDFSKDNSPPLAFRDINDGIARPRPEFQDEVGTAACSVFKLCTPSPKYHTRQTDLGDNWQRNYGFTSNIDFDTGPVTLTSVTGYRKIKDINRIDLDATPYPLLESPDSELNQKTASQELRVASNDGGSLSFDKHVRWLVGGYYMDSKFFRDQELLALGNSVGADYGQKLESYAVFGHADILTTDKLTISLGARESWDKKTLRSRTLCDAGASPCAGSASFNKFMYDGTVNYKFTPDVMAYVRYALGSRPGGINQTLEPYEMETVDSIEGGVKTSFWNHRLAVNSTAFYYKYKDIQRVVQHAFDDNGDGTTDRFARLTANAAASHAWGLELEVTARPIERLNANLAVGYLNAKYDDWMDLELQGGAIVPVDNSTLPVFRAPHWTVNAGVAYDIPVSNSFVATITPAADLNYVSEDYLTTEAFYPTAYDDGHTLLNASLQFAGQDDNYAFTFFVRNLLDEYYIEGGSPLGSLARVQLEGPPRTYGVRAEFKF